MIPDNLSAIGTALANHLWQSTLFAILVGFLTLALRNNRARVRYRLWLAASVKFLIPFSLLISLGGHLARSRGAVSVQNGLYSAMEEVSQPFSQNAASFVAPSAGSTKTAHLLSFLPEFLVALWLCGFVTAFGLWWLRWRRISGVVRAAVSMRHGREVDALRQLEQIAGVRKPTTLLFSQDSLEPGIFGIVRPVLIWPAGISEHLGDAHLKAILAHEIWHVRRRDNLAAAMHMVVEAVFWFHPLVWWLGARLVEEREHACDEEVLQIVNQPQVYAESILKTCEFCVSSPLACVSGVTGSDLKKRIVRIMTERVASRLDYSRKLLLIAAGFTAVAVPILFGLLNAAQSQAQSPAEDTTVNLPAYEIAAIKPDKSGIGPRILFRADGLTATKVTLQFLMKMAYGVEDDQIIGAPNWINSETYDVEAKVDSSEVSELSKLSENQRMIMFQRLLADRFRLGLHRETRDLPVYVLVIAKNGPKLQEAKAGDTYPNGMKGPDGVGRAGMMTWGGGRLIGQGIPIASMMPPLSQQLGRTVQDRTGLAGRYDIELHWTPDDAAGPRMGPPRDRSISDSGLAAESPEPSIFTAIQEQLGLKLESHKAPVEVLVIDHVETPSAN